MPMVSPSTVFNEIEETLYFLLSIVALLFLWRFRDKVLQVFTGDDSMHLDCSSLLFWSCCQCCGCCEGECTRVFTRWSCCPYNWRGQNAVQLLGQSVGIIPTSIEVCNVVAGDLPAPGMWNTKGDFYIELDYGPMPSMISSVVLNQPYKIVHFPDRFRLAVRNSELSEKVKIRVLKVEVLGKTVMGTCYIDPAQIVEWSKDAGMRMQRFHLVPERNHGLVDSPAWIAMEFMDTSDLRDLATYSAASMTVRLADMDTGMYRERDLSEFKTALPLLDHGMNEVDEPREEEISSRKRRRCLVRTAYGSMCIIFTLFLLLVILSIAYVADCHRRYKMLTAWSLQPHNGTTWPVGVIALREARDACNEKLLGTQMEGGQDECRPSQTQLNTFCHDCRWNESQWLESKCQMDQQPVPLAFSTVVTRGSPLSQLSFIWGPRHLLGLPCHPSTCEAVSLWEEWSTVVLITLVFLVICVVCTACQYAVYSRGAERKKYMKQRQIRADEPGQAPEGHQQRSYAMVPNDEHPSHREW